MGQTATKPDKVNIWSCEVKEADVAGKWTNLADKGPFQFCLLLENCFANKQQMRNEGSDYWFLLFAPSSLFFLLWHLTSLFSPWLPFIIAIAVTNLAKFEQAKKSNSAVACCSLITAGSSLVPNLASSNKQQAELKRAKILVRLSCSDTAVAYAQPWTKF